MRTHFLQDEKKATSADHQMKNKKLCSGREVNCASDTITMARKKQAVGERTSFHPSLMRCYESSRQCYCGGDFAMKNRTSSKTTPSCGYASDRQILRDTINNEQSFGDRNDDSGSAVCQNHPLEDPFSFAKKNPVHS